MLAAGLLERDVPRSTARASPRLYRSTAAGADLAAPALLAWAASALWHSPLCFGVPIAALALGAGGGADGAPLGLWPTGTLSFTCVVVVVNLKLLVASRTLTWLHVIVVAASIALYFGYLAAYSAIPPAKLAPLAPAGAMAGRRGRAGRHARRLDRAGCGGRRLLPPRRAAEREVGWGGGSGGLWREWLARRRERGVVAKPPRVTPGATRLPHPDQVAHTPVVAGCAGGGLTRPTPPPPRNRAVTHWVCFRCPH